MYQIETPKGDGIVSENQKNTLKQYESNRYKCIVSSDYDQLHRAIDNYFLGVRIKCK